MRMCSSVIALFLIGALNVLSVAAQNDTTPNATTTNATTSTAEQTCNVISECGVCTSGGIAARNKCVWCVNNKNLTTQNGFPESIAQRAGSCSATCFNESTDILGIPETKTTKTFRQGYDKEGFVGIDTAQVFVELRRGTIAEFTVKLTKGPVPFQLYFLLDLSESMAKILAAVKESGTELPSSFKVDDIRIRPEFEFGFGSFIDKTIPPFTYNRFDFKVRTYGFRHEVGFTTSANTFKGGLASVSVSGNNDAPEGGLDAVVQALYCDTLVKWKPLSTNALRLILMATDDTSHVAGDGIEAGLVWPHELKCHNQFFFADNELYVSELMNPLNRGKTRCQSTSGSNCWYHNVVHDYPSVDQIAEGLRERKTSIAFVVPEKGNVQYPGRWEHYNDMVEKSLKPDGVVAGDPLVNSNTLNFTRIVRNTYYQVIRKVPEFKAINGGDAEFEDFYNVWSACTPDSAGDRILVKDVNGGEIGIDLVYECTFGVTVSGLFGSPKKLTQLQSQGTFGEFELVVQSSSCACPVPPNPYFDVLVGNRKCNGAGNTSETECGECICFPGVSGEVCACSEESQFTQCPEAAASGLKCNAVGTCECGKCKCPPSSYGPACECSDKCDEEEDEERCGGPDAGTCFCETCECKDGYSGRKCECNNNLCRKEGDTELCSGVEDASCSCGICECPEPFSGDFCEFCDPVKAALIGKPDICGFDDCGQCTRTLEDGAEPGADTWGCECCFAVAGGTNDNSLCQWCYETNQCIARATITKAKQANPQETICTGLKTFTDENNQTVSELEYEVFENVTQCPPPAPADVVAIVTGTILGLLALIILALLLWRLLAYMNDKKEWENYEKDKARAKWQADNNPIFKSSVAEFENPIFE